MSFLSAVGLVMKKDLVIEARSREVLYTSALFAVLCVLVFAFGFVEEGRAEAGAAAAILWIAIAFAGTLALARVFDRERQNETLRALLLAPIPRPALYLGKLAGVLSLLFMVRRSSFRWLRCGSRRACSGTSCCCWRCLAPARSAMPLSAPCLRPCSPGRAAAPRSAGPAVSDHHPGHHCRSARDGGPAPA